jgi:hypothetical protein
MKRLLSIGLLPSWLASPLPAEATKSVRLVLPSQPSPMVGNIRQAFRRICCGILPIGLLCSGRCLGAEAALPHGALAGGFARQRGRIWT